MAKKCGKYSVHLVDDKGEGHWFREGDEYPSWAEKQIDNPLAFEGGSDPDPIDTIEPAAPSGLIGFDDGSSNEAGPPPRAGKGSGEQAWRDYAESVGVDVDEDDGRDDIIEKVEAAGHEV